MGSVASNGYAVVYAPDHPLATGKFVYEHRLVAWKHFGPFDRGLHVHHINGDKLDNRPENLQLLTPRQHRREHHRFDPDEVVGLYRSGLTTTAIAERVGTDAGRVSRILQAAGEPRRARNAYRKTCTAEEMQAALVGARSARDVAERLGVTRPVVRRLMRLHGVPAFRAGGHR